MERKRGEKREGEEGEGRGRTANEQMKMMIEDDREKIL